MEFQRKPVIEGIVGHLAKGESRWGSSDLFLLAEYWRKQTPVLMQADHLSRIELGKEYRFFGHLVGSGHKGLVIHLKIVAAQAVGSRPRAFNWRGQPE